MAGKVVCVTGASGFIASWLVKLLLGRGYTVRATVRNLSGPMKVEHLKSLEGAEERLQLFEADLMKQGSFEAVIDGCDGVFHTACPIVLENVDDPQVQIIEPVVNGTLDILRSCVKAQSIRRVVLTSSIATVMINRNLHTADGAVDETCFSDQKFCEENKSWFYLSKILAEEAARTFAEENGLDLIFINPGFVTGPILQPTLNVTSQCFLDFVTEGKSLALPGEAVVWGEVLVWSDVRDVAYAHILAFENPSANGRYCLVEKVRPGYEALNILSRLYPKLDLPKISGESKAAKLPYQVSNEKAKSLGLNFTSLEQSLVDTLLSLKEKNFISFDI